jgi:hypothetical protein
MVSWAFIGLLLIGAIVIYINRVEILAAIELRKLEQQKVTEMSQSAKEFGEYDPETDAPPLPQVVGAGGASGTSARDNSNADDSTDEETEAEESTDGNADSADGSSDEAAEESPAESVDDGQ